MAIADTDITLIDQGGQKQSVPQFADRISFAGEASYPTGGMLIGDGFAKKMKSGRTVLGIVAGDCGGYTPVWIPATKAVKVYRTGAVNTPKEEVPNATNLSGVTFNIVLLSN